MVMSAVDWFFLEGTSDLSSIMRGSGLGGWLVG